MPMYFGYLAHRDHGVPYKASRSGRQMQEDPRYAVRWSAYKDEARVNPELRRLIDGLQHRGFQSRAIIDLFDGLLQEELSRIRRRRNEEALDQG